MAGPNLDKSLAVALERELTAQHGPMMTGEPLRIALGFPSKESFRQAFARKTTPIPIFTLERRRGKFALTKDVAAWLALQRDQAAKLMNINAKETSNEKG